MLVLAWVLLLKTLLLGPFGHLSLFGLSFFFFLTDLNISHEFWKLLVEQGVHPSGCHWIISPKWELQTGELYTEFWKVKETVGRWGLGKNLPPWAAVFQGGYSKAGGIRDAGTSLLASTACIFIHPRFKTQIHTSFFQFSGWAFPERLLKNLSLLRSKLVQILFFFYWDLPKSHTLSYKSSPDALHSLFLRSRSGWSSLCSYCLLNLSGALQRKQRGDIPSCAPRWICLVSPGLAQRIY